MDSEAPHAGQPGIKERTARREQGRARAITPVSNQNSTNKEPRLDYRDESTPLKDIPVLENRRRPVGRYHACYGPNRRPVVFFS